MNLRGAAVVLGAAAVAEAVLRGRGVLLPVAILMGLCATVPLAVPSVAAAVTMTVATAATTGLDRLPVVSGVVASVACWTWLVRQRVRRRRAEAAERDVTLRIAADNLEELNARGERARIARELHDVVAHHISMISVQAETARLATPGMPELGAERLLAIGDTARTALTEMRRLLGVLREDAGTGPTRHPQPGLQQLLDLIDDTRAAGGTGVRLILRGEVAPLDPGLELTAYRIVQEALTNARRHAPYAAVDVEVRYTPEALHLRVRDNGPGPGASGAGGHGLLGMRERAAAVGGRLRAGPGTSGGFQVEAVLPVRVDV